MFGSLDFKPGKKGLSKVLGELEAEIMEAIWPRGACSVREIYEDLRLKKSIAYTTVMTIMTRLAEKGLLLKEKEGAAFIYHPAFSKEDFNRKVASEVISGLLDDFGREAVSQLVEAAGRANPETLDELERIIAERRKTGR